jgi:hypothetical protein
MNVKQRAFYGLVEGDTLQTLGQGIVLSGVDPHYAELHLVKINKTEAWIQKKSNHKLSYASTEANLGAPGILASLYLDLREKADSHSNPTLHSASKQANFDNMDLQFEYYQNNTPEGRAAIERCLKRTVLWNLSFLQWCRKGVYALLFWWVKKSRD